MSDWLFSGFVLFIYSPLSAVVIKDGGGFEVLRRGSGQCDVAGYTLARVARQDAHDLLTGWVKRGTDGQPHRDRETHCESTEGPLKDPRQGSKIIFLFNLDEVIGKVKRWAFIVPRNYKTVLKYPLIYMWSISSKVIYHKVRHRKIWAREQFIVNEGWNNGLNQFTHKFVCRWDKDPQNENAQ